MITVISGTNRRKSATLPVARQFYQMMVKYSAEEVKFLSLENLPLDIFHTGMYSENGQTKSLVKLQNDYLIPAAKFFIVMLEYNGGFPGVLKMFIDACSVRQSAKTFEGKKAAMAGLAAGRAGNIRGMDHLTGVLNYLGTVVMPYKLPISGADMLVDENGEIADADIQALMVKLVKEFIAF